MGIIGIVYENQAWTVGNCMQVNLDRQGITRADRQGLITWADSQGLTRADRHGITRADSQEAMIQFTTLLERL